MNRYIIINKTKWLEVLEDNKKPIPHWDGIYISEKQDARADLIEEILSQSTPLIPEIEKAFDAGVHEDYLNTIGKQDYISNLKLDI